MGGDDWSKRGGLQGEEGGPRTEPCGTPVESWRGPDTLMVKRKKSP